MFYRKMYQKIKSIKFESACTSFNQSLILKQKDPIVGNKNVIASLDIDSINLLTFSLLNSNPSFLSSTQIKIDPLPECIAISQFSIIEAQYLHFEQHLLFVVLSTHGLHVRFHVLFNFFELN